MIRNTEPEQIANGSGDYPIAPMLATSFPRPFDSSKHIFEVKWDGYRCIAHIYSERVRLQSRNLHDITGRFPELTRIWTKTNHDRVILDGEIVAFKDGVPSFSSLCKRESLLVYVVFDILKLGDEWLIEKPLIERKSLLTTIIKDSGPSSPSIVVSDFIKDKGKALFEAIREKGMEGVVAKESDGIYCPGVRSKSWLKIRIMKTIDAIICGYTVRPGGSIGALVLGIWVNDLLRYIGFVGTGISEREGKEILAHISHSDRAPFHSEDVSRMQRSRHMWSYQRPQPIPKDSMRNASAWRRTGEVHWVKPEHVCEVKYCEFTSDGVLRHPVYLRSRTDKDPSECTGDMFNLNLH